MPEPRLPIELWELVIDNLNDDRRFAFRNSALLACSLACKSFLPATRRLLFYHVHLTCREVAERFLDVICSLPSSTNPCRYVRKFRMSEGRCGIRSRWISKALPVLAERLLDVTTLEFETLLWNLLDDDGRRAILSGFLEIRDLKLKYCDFETSEQLNRFIASFPSLVNLHCSSSYWNDGPPTAALPQGLQSIALDSCQSLFFHHILSRNLQGSHGVRTLRFYDIEEEETENVGKLLKTLGSSLEELDFGHLYNALCFNQRYGEGQLSALIDRLIPINF